MLSPRSERPDPLAQPPRQQLAGLLLELVLGLLVLQEGLDGDLVGAGDLGALDDAVNGGDVDGQSDR
jgi:hypothetical protein